MAVSFPFFLGKLEVTSDPEGAGIVLDGEYYRQWPARHFVTTRAASTMRR